MLSQEKIKLQTSFVINYELGFYVWIIEIRYCRMCDVLVFLFEFFHSTKVFAFWNDKHFVTKNDNRFC